MQINQENKTLIYGLCGLIIFILCGFTYLSYRISKLEKKNLNVATSIMQQVNGSRKIYVYNMEEMVKLTGIPALNKKFGEDIAALDKEITEAENKIKKLKDAKVKAEFTDVYFKSLRLKRDELINKYTENMQNILNSINKALEEIAVKSGAPTIFMASSVAVKTKFVVDVTAQVVEMIKQNQTNK